MKSVAGISAGTSPTDQIDSTNSLLDAGAITQQEFDHLTAKTLTAA
jgi:hypothetical protein